MRHLKKNKTKCTTICVDNSIIISYDYGIINPALLYVPTVNCVRTIDYKIMFDLTSDTLMLLDDIIKKCVISVGKICNKCSNISNKCHACIETTYKLIIISTPLIHDNSESDSISKNFLKYKILNSNSSDELNKAILPLTDNNYLKNLYTKACIDYGLMGYFYWLKNKNNLLFDDQTFQYVIIMLCGTAYKKTRHKIKYSIDLEIFDDIKSKSCYKFDKLYGSYIK